MKITFIRHGESKANSKRILQHHIKGGLSKKGKEQAKKLGKRLSKEEFDMIYCSDSERAKETAKEILKHHKKVPVVYTEELREINRGIFVGQKGQEMWEIFLKSGESFAKWKPEEGESPNDLVKRVKKFLEKIYKKHKGQHVLFITHGAVNRSIKDICNNKTPSIDELKLGINENCCVNLLEFEKGKPKLKLYNCTRHLKLK